MIENNDYNKRINSPDIAGLKLTGKLRRRRKKVMTIIRRTLLVIFTMPLCSSLPFSLFARR